MFVTVLLSLINIFRETFALSLAEGVVTSQAHPVTLWPETEIPSLEAIPLNAKALLTLAQAAVKHFKHRKQLQRGSLTMEYPAA